MTARVAIAVSMPCPAWRRAVAGPARRARTAAAATLAAALREGCPVPAACELSLVLADDALALRLNRDYRGKD
ncbi:MAG: rRNA maturation factor, partial [Alphaproteobacteria bacterium]